MLSLIAANMTIFWVVAFAVFLLAEALTAGLTSIWFAIGALAALVAALFNAPICSRWPHAATHAPGRRSGGWCSIGWFFVISIIALIITRPLVSRFVNNKSQPTNADMVIGMSGIVTEMIDNLAGRGAVAVAGKVWTARSADGETIPLGATVTADRIEGVKLFVRPAAESFPPAESPVPGAEDAGE